MENIGMDLGKKESPIAIIMEAGELIEKRMRTERRRLMQYTLLSVRDSLVRSRARLVTLTQAILSREGFRVPAGNSGCFVQLS